MVFPFGPARYAYISSCSSVFSALISSCAERPPCLSLRAARPSYPLSSIPHRRSIRRRQRRTLSAVETFMTSSAFFGLFSPDMLPTARQAVLPPPRYYPSSSQCRTTHADVSPPPLPHPARHLSFLKIIVSDRARIFPQNARRSDASVSAAAARYRNEQIYWLHSGRPLTHISFRRRLIKPVAARP